MSGLGTQGLFVNSRMDLQVPHPSQATVFDSHGQPSCDLERLLSCVTPVLMLNEKLAIGEEGKQAATLVSPLARSRTTAFVRAGELSNT